MVKSFLPFTTAKSRKHHLKYLRKKLGGHDVLMMVEWADGKLTELPADLHPERDGWYEATNGLMFAPAGEGVDPVDYHGVPVIRTYAAIACPISTTAAIQAELEENGEFKLEHNDKGQPEKLVKYKPAPDADSDEGLTNGHGPTPEDADDADGDLGKAMSDGGAVELDKEYDLRPPSGAVGWSFGTDEVAQRAPNAVSSNMLKRAYDYGFEEAMGDGGRIRTLLMGMGIMLGIVLLLGILGAVFLNLTSGGGGGGGGGGGQTLSFLALLAGTGAGRAAVLNRLRTLTEG